MGTVLLITANVGSLFDDTDQLRRIWLERLVERIRKSNALFVALHMQETGGKHFQTHSDEVPVVIEELFRMLQPEFSTGLAFLDLDYDAVEEYTALGSVFFVRESAFSSVQLFKFRKSKFKRLKQKGLLIDRNLKDCSRIRKEKFPREFWPAFRWGRKGYLHTRWSIDGRCVDLINIHLFHDESNLCFRENPSLYSGNRQKAVKFVLERYSTKFSDSTVPVFIFGDFNFRLNAQTVINKLAAKTREYLVETESAGDESPKCSSEDSDPALRFDSSAESPNLVALEYRRCDNCSPTLVLRIEKKKFEYFDSPRFANDWHLFRDDDRELSSFSDLIERPIGFPPTYPWSEDPIQPNTFMDTRIPAWCDRILMNKTAAEQIQAEPLYDIIGKGVCMGDHKPVFLSFTFNA